MNRDVFSPRGRATDTSGVLYSDDITLVKEFIFIVEVNQLQLCCDSWKCAAAAVTPDPGEQTQTCNRSDFEGKEPSDASLSLGAAVGVSN